MELQLSVSNSPMISEEKSKFTPRGRSHSRLHVSTFQASYITSLRCCGTQIEALKTSPCLNSTIQRVLFHSTPHIFCATRFSIPPCSSERVHILKCREMWKWNLPDAAFCDITNFYWPHTRAYFLTLIVALVGSQLDLRVQRKSLSSSIFDKWLFINQANLGNFSMTLIYSSGALGRSITFVICCDVSDENIPSSNLSIWSKDEE